MFPTKHTLYDDFSYKGKFWLALAAGEEPHKVDGVLRVTAGKNIGLELFGDFVLPRRVSDAMVTGASPAVIHGQTDGGQALTLFDSFRTSRHLGGAGHVRSDYTSNLCIIGAWFDGEDDVRFDVLELGLSHLEGWQDVIAFAGKRLGDDDARFVYGLTYKAPVDVKVAVSNPPMTFSLTGTLYQDEERNRSITLRHESRIDLTPAAPLSLDTMFRLVADVQQFFTLMVGEQVFVRKLRGRNKPDDSDAGTETGLEEAFGIPCDVFFNQFDLREAKELMAHRMTMPYATLGAQFPQTLLNWFESLAILRPVYDVFFATYRVGRMFAEARFLQLVQAVESFDRRAKCGQYLPDDEYKSVYETLVAAIPLSVPDGLREKMKKGTLKHANEYSLRKRVTEMLKGLSAEERDLICTNAGEFAGLVVATRNNLTHVLGDRPPDDNIEILKDQQLRHASKKLELLLVILILKRLDLPVDLIVKRVKTCDRFNLVPFALTQTP